jgi:hypothetical protein
MVWEKYENDYVRTLQKITTDHNIKIHTVYDVELDAYQVIATNRYTKKKTDVGYVFSDNFKDQVIEAGCKVINSPYVQISI